MEVGLTLVEPLADEVVKLPGVIASVLAPVAAQLRVLLAPEFTLVGFAWNEVIVGLDGGGVVPDFTLAQPDRPKPTQRTKSNVGRTHVERSDR